ncbi:hypothetical protein EZV62_002728 [Acer yangbiense]|uniref:C2H2-type domain-containing protein n=1 Tax=Acer yangbiense TaxID=1000413 RepID=A0A5C7IYE0_9ROSI|nr:hypothetical protein EZV62_002728 [Acer yangbiense]
MEGAADHDDHDHDQPTSAENYPDQDPVRTYDCTFCKRGFSNAQALGGHMNIHRKDKAKLKKQQTPPVQVPSSNINTTTTHVHHHHHQNQKSSSFDVSKIPQQSYSPPIIPTINRFSSSSSVQPSIEAVKVKRAYWNMLGDHHHHNYHHLHQENNNKTAHVVVAAEEVKQLPLFVEIPLMINTSDITDEHHHQRRVSSSSSSSRSFSELDLELRLGPDPQESSSSATGTKKFF